MTHLHNHFLLLLSCMLLALNLKKNLQNQTIFYFFMRCISKCFLNRQESRKIIASSNCKSLQVFFACTTYTLIHVFLCLIYLWNKTLNDKLSGITDKLLIILRLDFVFSFILSKAWPSIKIQTKTSNGGENVEAKYWENFPFAAE